MTKQQWDYVHKMGDSLRNSFKNITSVFAPSCISHSVLTKRDWRLLKVDEVSLPQALRCWELNTRRAHRLPHKNRRGVKKKNGKMSKSHQNSTVTNEDHHKKKKRKNGGNMRRKKRRRNMHKNRNKQDCRHRLVERCSWPQCNHSCPKLHNPFTGEEMDFIELLKSFGLDMTSVANALGIDNHTLNNMDHEELLNLLTQQAS
uniref:Uncharacterized protein n=1 Tax=Lygus hesperus TaxID=30085 RepID=A0A0A9Y990_LYGHE